MEPDNRSGDVSDSTLVLPVVEEAVRIEKRAVSTGRVRVNTITETVEDLASATLENDEIEVIRVPVDREVTEAPALRVEGDVTIIPVMEEVLFVEKRLVLKEELHLRRRTRTEAVEIPVSLRRQRAVIEREGAEQTEPNQE